MKLFIVNKNHATDQVCGEENLKRAHQVAYQELQKSIAEYNIPFCLDGEYNENNSALFRFVKVDWKNDVYYYEFECTIGGF